MWLNLRRLNPLPLQCLEFTEKQANSAKQTACQPTGWPPVFGKFHFNDNALDRTQALIFLSQAFITNTFIMILKFKIPYIYTFYKLKPISNHEVIWCIFQLYLLSELSKRCFYNESLKLKPNYFYHLYILRSLLLSIVIKGY